MKDSSTLRIAAAFSFLSPLSIFSVAPFAAKLGGAGGPGPIDFGNGELLDRLAQLGADAMRVDLFALLGPLFALPAAFGWYVLLRSTNRSAAQLGVALWLIGMVFIIFQDALQLALVSTLPAAHAAADIETRAAIEAVGGAFGYTIDVFAFVGHMPNGLGFIVLALLMWGCATIPKWIAGLGLVAATLELAAGVLGFVFPDVVWFAVGVPVGIVLVLVAIAALGVVMLREAKRAAPALVPSPA